MAAGENAISDSSQVSLDILRANVDQYNFEIATSRIHHELEIVFSGQRGLDREALTSANVFLRGF